MVTGGGADASEERPEWLPDGWKVSTRTRKKGKVDRYYVSPSGQTLRSKADVISYATKHKATSVEHKSVAKPALPLNAKHQPESNNLQVLHEDKPFSLPDGWIVETKMRKGGQRSGASYKIYCNPVTGFKCYSLKEVNRYIAAGELSTPTSRAKRCATLDSSDSVLIKKEGVSVKQPSHLKNSSRTKKDKTPIVAATHNKSPARRNLSGSSVSNSSGGKVHAEKTKDAFEDLSLDEAGDIFESIDKIIQNLSQDLKIPDISIAYSSHLEQEEFDLVDKTEACYNSNLTAKQSTKQLGAECSENTAPCELKRIETQSSRKRRRQTDQHSAATNEKGKSNGTLRSGPEEVVNGTSVDMLPKETAEMSNGNLPLSDKSHRKRKSSKVERSTDLGKQSELDSLNLSLPNNRDSKLEDDPRKLEQTMKKSNRTNKEHHPFTPVRKHMNKTTVSMSSRSSRRLAGLDVGPDAHANSNENAPRKRRLRI